MPRWHCWNWFNASEPRAQGANAHQCLGRIPLEGVADWRNLSTLDMPRLAFVVQYDGTNFSGSQYQSNARTVQGGLEAAAKLVLKISDQRMRMASRTDAGVHAHYQVASCDTHVDLTPKSVRDAMNANLPTDLAIRKVHIVPDTFDPRRDAVKRSYAYRINVSGVRSPFLHRTEVIIRSKLDVESMAQAARYFEGVHDFASFAAIDPSYEGRSTVRRIDRFSVQNTSNLLGRWVSISVHGSSFLRQQVRRMVGMLVDIGSGRSDPETVTRLLENPKLGAVTTLVPARGLFLTGIEYPPETLDNPLEANDAHDTGCFVQQH